MVIAEQQNNGSYRLRGRSTNERAYVPFWPCQSWTIRKGAVEKAPEAWIKECIEVAKDMATDS